MRSLNGANGTIASFESPETADRNERNTEAGHREVRKPESQEALSQTESLRDGAE